MVLGLESNLNRIERRLWDHQRQYRQMLESNLNRIESCDEVMVTEGSELLESNLNRIESHLKFQEWTVLLS